METLTKQELFQAQAPNFNFEYDADQLLKIALERGYLTPIEGEDDLYEVNNQY